MIRPSLKSSCEYACRVMQEVKTTSTHIVKPITLLGLTNCKGEGFENVLELLRDKRFLDLGVHISYYETVFLQDHGAPKFIHMTEDIQAMSLFLHQTLLSGFPS